MRELADDQFEIVCCNSSGVAVRVIRLCHRPCERERECAEGWFAPPSAFQGKSRLWRLAVTECGLRIKAMISCCGSKALECPRIWRPQTNGSIAQWSNSLEAGHDNSWHRSLGIASAARTRPDAFQVPRDRLVAGLFAALGIDDGLAGISVLERFAKLRRLMRTVDGFGRLLQPQRDQQPEADRPHMHEEIAPSVQKPWLRRMHFHDSPAQNCPAPVLTWGACLPQRRRGRRSTYISACRRPCPKGSALRT